MVAGKGTTGGAWRVRLPKPITRPEPAARAAAVAARMSSVVGSPGTAKFAKEGFSAWSVPSSEGGRAGDDEGVAVGGEGGGRGAGWAARPTRRFRGGGSS